MGADTLTLATSILKGIVEDQDVRLVYGRSQSPGETPRLIEVYVYDPGAWPSDAEMAAGKKRLAQVCTRLDEAQVPYAACCGAVIVPNDARCWERVQRQRQVEGHTEAHTERHTERRSVAVSSVTRR